MCVCVCVCVCVCECVWEVHQQYGADGFSGVGHEDGSIIPTHLREVRQSSTVVQVEVTAGGK